MFPFFSTYLISRVPSSEDIDIFPRKVHSLMRNLCSIAPSIFSPLDFSSCCLIFCSLLFFKVVAGKNHFDTIFLCYLRILEANCYWHLAVDAQANYMQTGKFFTAQTTVICGCDISLFQSIKQSQLLHVFARGVPTFLVIYNLVHYSFPVLQWTVVEVGASSCNV